MGAELEIKDKNSWTPLMHACKIGNLELVELLISKQADVTAKNAVGDSCITKA